MLFIVPFFRELLRWPGCLSRSRPRSAAAAGVGPRRRRSARVLVGAKHENEKDEQHEHDCRCRAASRCELGHRGHPVPSASDSARLRLWEGRAGMGCHTPYANAPGAKCADTQIRVISLPESGEGTSVCGFGSMGVWRERRPRIPVRLEGGPREQEGQSDHQRDEG